MPKPKWNYSDTTTEFLHQIFNTPHIHPSIVDKHALMTVVAVVLERTILYNDNLVQDITSLDLQTPQPVPSTLNLVTAPLLYRYYYVPEGVLC